MNRNFTLSCAMWKITKYHYSRGPGWLNELGSWIYLTTHTSLPTIRRGFAPDFVNYKKNVHSTRSRK